MHWQVPQVMMDLRAAPGAVTSPSAVALSREMRSTYLAHLDIPPLNVVSVRCESIGPYTGSDIYSRINLRSSTPIFAYSTFFY